MLCRRQGSRDDITEAPATLNAVMIDGDFFSGGASAALERRIDRDASVSGGPVAVRGPAKGDAVVTGEVDVADTPADMQAV